MEALRPKLALCQVQAEGAGSLQKTQQSHRLGWRVNATADQIQPLVRHRKINLATGGSVMNLLNELLFHSNAKTRIQEAHILLARNVCWQ